MIRLSIIVPFYNVEKYIEQCIRSLYNQDIPCEEYEVICVDDYSLDRSRCIVERLQKEYSTLHLVVLPENRKLGGARNEGVKNARGKYIWFVDSDDEIAPMCLGTLLKEMDEYELDVLQFDCCKFADSIGYLSAEKAYQDERIYTGEDFITEAKHGPWYYRCVEAWRKIIKRTFFVENNLWFVENKMYEDTDWMVRLAVATQRTKHCNYAPYYYRDNPTSVTRKKDTPLKLYFQICQINRCANNIVNAKTELFRSVVSEMVRSNSIVWRQKLKKLTCWEKIAYYALLHTSDVVNIHPYVNWRTWFAIRYAITWFA